MNPLEYNIENKGISYTCILLIGRSAIYAIEVVPGIIYYRVFINKMKQAQRLFVRDYPEREKFQRNDALSYTAWTYPDLGRAIEKLLDLYKKNQSK